MINILEGHIWAKGAKIRPETIFFCHFLKFSFLVFLEVTYHDSLQQCLTSSRNNIQEKNVVHQIWAKAAKIGPKTRFFAIFLSFIYH